MKGLTHRLSRPGETGNQQGPGQLSDTKAAPLGFRLDEADPSEYKTQRTFPNLHGPWNATPMHISEYQYHVLRGVVAFCGLVTKTNQCHHADMNCLMTVRTE